MGKGLRSNEKKALRTIRRNAVRVDPITEKRDAERFAKIQQTVEAGRAARETADQARQAETGGEAPMDVNTAGNQQNFAAVEKMDIDTPKQSRHNIPLNKKSNYKSKRTKTTGINAFHKKKAKGKRHSSRGKKKT